jgi:glycosyltransferase involved in cell wall biosynthesis
VRILIVTNLFPDARLPAFGTFVAEHAEALRRAGAEVEVVAIMGIPVHTAVLRKYLSLSVRTAAVALGLRFRGRCPDVVEAHVAYPTALLGWLAARITGARLVVFSHGSDVTASVRGLRRRWRRWIVRRGDLHVATSRFIAGELIRRFEIDPRSVIVLSPGIDFGRFSVAESHEARAGVLFVGRLARGKGVYELVQAVGRLDPPAPLRFVGGGPEHAGLERTAAALGVHATFDGPLPPQQVAMAMRAAAVVAVPSTYPEGLGLVALEGMAAGALVVGSAIGGIPESVVDGETGWLVPPGDVAALAAALAEALSVSDTASERRTAIVSRARDAARAQDVNAVAARTLASYAALVR